MYKGYKIKFNFYEMVQFNQIETVKKIKLMSVYSYLIKYSVDGKLTISASKLHKMYARYHKGVSLAYFKQLLLNLEEMSLITIDKTKKIRTFFITRKPPINNDAADKVADKIADKKNSESIDTTDVEYNSQEHNTKSFINTNTLTSSTPSFGEIVSSEELIETAKNILKSMRIRNSAIMKNVLKKLDGRENINRAGMFNYVTKVIIEKKAEFEVWIRESIRFNRIKKAKRSQGSFNSYEQRKYKKGDIERRFGIIL